MGICQLVATERIELPSVGYQPTALPLSYAATGRGAWVVNPMSLAQVRVYPSLSCIRLLLTTPQLVLPDGLEPS